MARLVLVHGRDLYSRLIQLETFSYWSHAAVEVSDNGLQLGALSQGVAYSYPPPGVIVSGFDVRGVDMGEVVEVMKEQLGKPYDWSAIAGIALRRDWRAPDSWFCSELVAYAFEKAGLPLLRTDHLNRITPGQLALSPYLKPVYEMRRA